MNIEILDINLEAKNFRVGLVDFKVSYPNEKWEIFRAIPYFEKEDRSWLSMPSIMKDEKWLPRYERSGDMKALFDQVVTEIHKYLSALEPSV